MISIWHNPRCSKSRQTLGLLEDRSLDIEVRKYLDDSPTVEELRNACGKLGLTAIEIVRTNEAVFKDLGLSKTDADEILFAAMATHPILIERPIVFANEKAAIGRPPESVLSIL